MTETSSSSSSANPTNPTPAPPIIPLRKQLKDAAKKAKSDGSPTGKKPKSASQVVPGWELTVGIEIHAQLNTSHKLFSSAATSFNDSPNTHVALFDSAMPGSQPQFQSEALIPALRAAIALGCEVQKTSQWDRKHYFWWDQPNGYQITQYYHPFARQGKLVLAPRDGIATQDGESVTVGIERIQMEQDTAKTTAQPGGRQWIDLNRVGMPLVEIITKPDMHYPATAAAVVRKIQALLYATDACVNGMETGGLRADVNVSVRRTGDESRVLGTRTEIKNLSSFRAVEDAIIAERDRQIGELEKGGKVNGETRGWTLGGSETYRLRGKEGEVDYRYMPDPDLGPVVIGDDLVEHLKMTMGTLPDQELDNLVSKYGLTPKDAISLVNLENGDRVEYFYNVIENLGEWLAGAAIDIELQNGIPKHYSLVANWILHELGRLTADPHSSTATSLEVTADGQSSRIAVPLLGELLYHLYRHAITAKVAKELLFALYRGDVQSSYLSVTDAIEASELWFRELSGEEYIGLCEQALEGEEQTLKQFAPGYKKYPQGKLMFLVGKMIKIGQEERIDPVNAQKFMRMVIEEKVGG
ncbi:aspartyl/glutamyl-tRNA amidotransferase subunit B [Zalerion maritima]|uniref:Glutamyl-tRNA(Gln) amidotransferase subunit B, mitochondrial n=1 Tax=Zalerion maritima TaxID=339359 RepID=A0AAD5RPQ2_9PEZI|nr:aspartyl/glutamyl-tRNA amidotransferase subunit B [Zalerion maritima]